MRKNEKIVFIVATVFTCFSFFIRGSSMQKIIDLTHLITTSMSVHSYDEPVSIKQIRTLADNKYNDWQLTSGMHVGTHIDGPGHLNESRILLSSFPADKFVGSGYLIDARHKAIDVSLLKDLPAEEGLIVLILTGFGKQFGTDKYYKNYPTLSEAFAHELVKHNIKMVGIDCFSPDNYPFPVHKIFLDNGVLIIENLTNLENLVGIKKFNIIALPLKIETDSALARVIAFVE